MHHPWALSEAGVAEGRVRWLGQSGPGLGEPCPGNEKGVRALATRSKERAEAAGLSDRSGLALCFRRVALSPTTQYFLLSSGF